MTDSTMSLRPDNMPPTISTADLTTPFISFQALLHFPWKISDIVLTTPDDILTMPLMLDVTIFTAPRTTPIPVLIKVLPSLMTSFSVAINPDFKKFLKFLKSLLRLRSRQSRPMSRVMLPNDLLTLLTVPLIILPIPASCQVVLIDHTACLKVLPTDLPNLVLLNLRAISPAHLPATCPNVEPIAAPAGPPR